MEASFDDEVTIRFVRYANPETGWAVLEAAVADGTSVALVGPLVHLEERDRARVSGTWVNDGRYGAQVKVSQARPLPPADRPALAAYLKRVRHVGGKRAEALIDRFGAESVLETIDREGAGAFAAAGLRGRRAAEAAESWQSLRVTRQLHLLLAPHGLAYLAGRIHEHYGTAAHEIVAGNPYELTSLFGVGFAIADRIALAGGTSASGPERERAAILHVLGEAERGGSTCLPAAELEAQAASLLGARPAPTAIPGLVDAGALVREGDWVYRAATAALEAELAGRVAELVQAPPSQRLDLPAGTALTGEGGARDGGATQGDGGATQGDGGATQGDGGATQGDGGAAQRGGPETASQLTAEQREALAAAFAHRLTVITGGPGTGKTTLIKSIAAEGLARRARVMLLAPTGRAAVRMTEASGLRATTIHSALGWVPGEGPTHDEQDPLACELLIVDETSMANLELLVTLLRAVGSETHVVLVGDADQLAPVGAGKPFAELVSCKRVPGTGLTHIFRQAAGSMIVQGAHAIRRGELPDFAAGPGMRRDLFLIERGSPRTALAEIVSLVTERLPAHYGVDPVRDIQVFAPVYRGELGIDAINLALRDALNPAGTPVLGGRLRLGDKLMMTGRNLHELGLMNGTLLRLLDEVPERKEHDEAAALLVGAEDAVFRLPPADAERLRLAYACSVHRGQGIELPVAVIVAHPACGAFFLRREMLYTAVTRARLATVIVGTRAVLARAVETADTGRRHGRLGERLAASP